MSATPFREIPVKIAKLVRHRASIRFKSTLSPNRALQPLFVLAGPRTGSYLLVDLLNGLPGVTMRGEVLNPREAIGVRSHLIRRTAVLSHIYRSVYSLPGRIGGAKLILDHLFDVHHIRVEELHERFPDAKYIVLYRGSMAEQLVSYLRAARSSQWRSTDRHRGGHEDFALSLNPSEILKFYEKTRQRYRKIFDNDAVMSRSLVISYEELTRNPELAFRSSVCPFLGVEMGAMQTSLRKQTTRALPDLVLNYDEVADLLTGPVAQLNLG